MFCLITVEHAIALLSWISWSRLLTEDILRTFFQKSRQAFDHMVSFLSQIFYFFFSWQYWSWSVLQWHVSALVAWMPKVLQWVVWLSVFAHIVRLVMPYSKRLLLSRGHLIVRGRWCFQESFFWPIKVAVNLGTSCRNLPFSSWPAFSHSASFCAVFHTNTLLSRLLRCWSAVFVLFDWTEGTGQKYVHMFQDRNSLQLLFACENWEQSMSEALESILYQNSSFSLSLLQSHYLATMLPALTPNLWRDSAAVRCCWSWVRNCLNQP